MEQKPQNTPTQAEIISLHNKLKVEYSELFRTSIDLEEEKREHNLVIETIKDLEPIA